MTALRNAFWVLALFVLGLYAFFVALGAWDPAEVLPLTIVMGVLALLWVVHAWLSRRTEEDRDPRLVHARERRGF
jgi:uncharacterized membrane protein YhaH (DUF805 family)